MQLVINTSRPVAVVARELGVKEQTLGRWVNLYKDRQDAGDGALNETERAELARLLKENSELKMDRRTDPRAHPRPHPRLPTRGLPAGPPKKGTYMQRCNETRPTVPRDITTVGAAGIEPATTCL